MAGELIPGHKVMRFGHLRTVVKVATDERTEGGKSWFTRIIHLDTGESWRCYYFRRVTVTDDDPLTPAPPA